MEELNEVLQSLSPYVVIALIGDPIKTLYASMWGVRSPMPTVWINQFTAPDKKTVIANLWDLPLNNKSIMIPDHTIIFIDYSYRRMMSDVPFNLSDQIAKDHPDAQTVILIGSTNENKLAEDKKICRTFGIHYLHIIVKEDVRDLIMEKSLYTYRLRCNRVDKQIKELLFKH